MVLLANASNRSPAAMRVFFMNGQDAIPAFARRDGDPMLLRVPE
jgi:hypothetical protein